MRRAAPGPSKGPPLTSKPLCSCKNCASKKCPNILDKIKIPTVDHTPPPKRHLGLSMRPKGKKKCKVAPTSPVLALPPAPKETDSLLEVLRKGRECGCDVVSRAAAGSLHRLAGLQGQRSAIAAQAAGAGAGAGAYCDPADDPDADEYSCDYRPPFLEDAD